MAKLRSNRRSSIPSKPGVRARTHCLNLSWRWGGSMLDPECVLRCFMVYCCWLWSAKLCLYPQGEVNTVYARFAVYIYTSHHCWGQHVGAHNLPNLHYVMKTVLHRVLLRERTSIEWSIDRVYLMRAHLCTMWRLPAWPRLWTLSGICRAILRTICRAPRLFGTFRDEAIHVSGLQARGGGALCCYLAGRAIDTNFLM